MITKINMEEIKEFEITTTKTFNVSYNENSEPILPEMSEFEKESLKIAIMNFNKENEAEEVSVFAGKYQPSSVEVIPYFIVPEESDWYESLKYIETLYEVCYIEAFEKIDYEMDEVKEFAAILPGKDKNLFLKFLDWHYYILAKEELEKLSFYEFKDLLYKYVSDYINEHSVIKEKEFIDCTLQRLFSCAFFFNAIRRYEPDFSPNDITESYIDYFIRTGYLEETLAKRLTHTNILDFCYENHFDNMVEKHNEKAFRKDALGYCEKLYGIKIPEELKPDAFFTKFYDDCLEFLIDIK